MGAKQLHVLEIQTDFMVHPISERTTWEQVEASCSRRRGYADLQIATGTGTAVGMYGMIEQQLNSIGVPRPAVGRTSMAELEDMQRAEPVSAEDVLAVPGMTNLTWPSWSEPHLRTDADVDTAYCATSDSGPDITGARKLIKQELCPEVDQVDKHPNTFLFDLDCF